MLPSDDQSHGLADRGGPKPDGRSLALLPEMQTLTALFIMALAPLVAGFGAFTEDPANANKHIPGCISAQEHVPKEPTAWSSHPASRQAPGLGAAFGWD